MKSWSGRYVGLERIACLIILVALVALRIWDPPPLEELRLRTFDLYQIISPRADQRRPAVIVDIDEASLKELGQWPWPRTRIAEIVDAVTRRGARAIGFDIIFPEPDRTSPAFTADLYHDLDEETRKKLRLLPSNDQALSTAMSRSRVVVGQAGTALSNQSLESGSGLDSEPEAEPAQTAGFALIGPDPLPNLVSFPALLRNVPIIERAAAGRGLITIKPDRDGVVRRVPLAMVAGGNLSPALSLAVMQVGTKSEAIIIRSDEGGITNVGVQGREIPTDRNGRMWVHFGPHDKMRFVSAADVLNDRVAPDRFTQRLALVGTSAIGLLDVKTTPIDPAMPGVEVNAQIIENMLTGALLLRPNYSESLELVVAALLGAATIILTPIMGAGPAFLLGAANTSLLTGTSWYLFYKYHIIIDYTYPLISTMTVYLALVFMNYFREEKHRKEIRSAFSYYISPDLVDELARNPDKLSLGGEERQITILFSDVRGFTTISEQYKDDPQGLTSLMNRYLTPMTNVVIANKGTIDKYIGDAIMAFWNAPLLDAEHERNSCAAALEMLTRLQGLNDELDNEARKSDRPLVSFKIGIGINTGRCVVGNMGSDFRFDYSVLGDSVNLASRLEGRSKGYGLPIVVGSTTARAARERFATLEIDLVQVKGKKQPEAVFTLLGREDVLHSVRFSNLRQIHDHMLACYRQQNWIAALESIEHCRKAADGFNLSALYNIYTSRTVLFQENKPPPDWNGVFVYEEK